VDPKKIYTGDNTRDGKTEGKVGTVRPGGLFPLAGAGDVQERPVMEKGRRYIDKDKPVKPMSDLHRIKNECAEKTSQKGLTIGGRSSRRMPRITRPQSVVTRCKNVGRDAEKPAWHAARGTAGKKNERTPRRF